MSAEAITDLTEAEQKQGWAIRADRDPNLVTLYCQSAAEQDRAYYHCTLPSSKDELTSLSDVIGSYAAETEVKNA